MSILQRTIFTWALALVTVFTLVGCGGSSVVFTPDYSHVDLRTPDLKRDNVRILKVTDNRQKPSRRIGTARVGMVNKQVPYVLQGELADVVKAMLDTLIVGRQGQDRFIPVTVSVDMFEVGENLQLFAEEAYFACNLRFNYPVTPDSMGHQVVFVKQTSKNVVDVTDEIEPLIYSGMAESARRFVMGTLDANKNIMVVSSDSAVLIRAADSSRVAINRQKVVTEPKPVSVDSSDRLTANGLSLQYAHGEKVQTGVRVSYLMLSRKKDSQFFFGLGIGLTYFDIINNKDQVSGNFISLGGRLVGRYYFSHAPTTAYIGGNVALSGGTERINYGNKEESSFFFGPTIEEVFGLSLGRVVSLEFGSYQLLHFNSKLLPSDIGFVAGVSFGL